MTAAISIPRSMRAAFIRETGGVDNIQVGELSVPRPGPTDVLVRMEASDVNHVDLFVRSGAYRTHTPFPFVIGRAIDVWWDTSGRNDVAQCLPLLDLGGRAVVMSGLRGSDPTLPVGALYTNDLTLHGFAISNASIRDLARAARTINRLLASGRLHARVGAVFRLSEAAQAHAALASGSVRGRIVVVP